MQEREVRFKDKQGREIVGFYQTPDWTKPLPAVIVCHGFKGDCQQPHIRNLADALAAKGLASLRFDFTGGPGQSSLPFADMTVSYEVEVLDQAVQFLRAQQEVDKTKIGLVGHSLGGLVVCWYASTHPEIAAVSPLSGVYNFEPMWRKAYGEASIKEFKEKGATYVFSERLKRPLQIKEGFYTDALNYNMDKVVDNLVCPILVVHGTGDEAVTVDHAQHFYDRSFSKVKELQVIKGSDHNYTKPEHLKEVVDSVSFWFYKQLSQ